MLREEMDGGFNGMGSEDVKLQYIDDDPDSYAISLIMLKPTSLPLIKIGC